MWCVRTEDPSMRMDDICFRYATRMLIDQVQYIFVSILMLKDFLQSRHIVTDHSQCYRCAWKEVG